LKENDAFLTDIDARTKQIKRQPIRVVMNNQTITLYADDDPESKIHTFNIDQTSIKRDEFCCVKFLDSLSKHKVCGFQADCGKRVTNKWANNWIRDFNTFKYDCSTKRQTAHIKRKVPGQEEDDDIGELFDNAKKETNELERKTISYQTKLIRKKINDKREKVIMHTVQEAEKRKAQMQIAVTQNVGLKALKKENKIENLIEHEEQDREHREFKVLAKRIQKEKQKKKCTDKAMKKRQIDTQILEDRREAANEENEVKEEMKLEVDMKRREIKRKIANMRQRAKRRKAQMETELQKIRTQMAKDLMLANKDGDMRLCQQGKKSPGKRGDYCDANFVDDYLKNYDCKDGENFCYMCCESEFGNNFIDKRNECYDMCDGKQPKQAVRRDIPFFPETVKFKPVKPEDKKLGGWVWSKNPEKKKKTPTAI